MGTVTMGTKFPAILSNEMLNLVRGKSSIARMSGQRPLSFVGTDVFTFTLDKEADIVGEGGSKSVGGATVAPVQVRPFKVEYSARFSDEFMIASEETRLETLRAFTEGFAAKAARALDIAAIHGFNPRTGQASAVIGNNNFDYVLSSNTTTATTSANADVETAVAAVQGREHEVTGMIMAPAFRSSLASETKADGTPLLPELSWGAAPAEIKGLPVDVNNTVSFGSSDDLAVLGNYRDFIRWGMAKDIFIKTYDVGNPDNSEDGDLASLNQILIRGECYIGYGILVPDAFQLIVSGE
jgi:HK97 family phage major capsid protein